MKGLILACAAILLGIAACGADNVEPPSVYDTDPGIEARPVSENVDRVAWNYWYSLDEVERVVWCTRADLDPVNLKAAIDRAVDKQSWAPPGLADKILHLAAVGEGCPR